MANIEKLVDRISAELFEHCQIPSYEQLLEIVRKQAELLNLYPDSEPYSEEEIIRAADMIRTRHDTTMGMGTLFAAESYTPWLVNRRGEIDFYYWHRYERLLQEKLSKDVVGKLDEITDKIIDHLEDPHKDGAWERKGLVVGNVQSGKTANYTGVLCKAADAGYKVIVVLGGMLNSLRNQTQQRIDSDFLGYSTVKKREIGASKFDNSRRPVSMTTANRDFNITTADRVQIDLNALTEPVVFVLKKNVRTLQNLRNWLAASNKRGLSNYPLLLIDDEADQASINVNKADRDPTKINQGIRELLKMFPRNSYVGYTATPFANIFISPDSEHEMCDGEMYRDLFPRDFILSLDPPSDYVGPTTVFGDAPKIRMIREIDDNEDILPLVHKINFVPQGLPPSLKKAIKCFMLIKTIRELDGQTKQHHSMMINVTRFTDVQEEIKALVASRLKSYREEIRSYAGLPEGEALRESSLLRELKSIWEEEFATFKDGMSRRGFTWAEVQSHLNASISSIVVVSINNKSTDRLDYDDYPNGRSLIAVGGLGLSRGLTLHGLSVSYFLRNSIMYDTLLQMGRWFGYRPGYAELCRLFMTRNATSWYDYITSAVEELREEFREMERLGLTPLEFGLKVRSHPAALIVTARNKMRDAEQFVSQIALEGRFAETSRLINDETVFRDNTEVLEAAITKANDMTEAERDSLGWLWRDVPLDVIEHVISGFKNAPDCLLTTKTPLLDYIHWLKQDKGISSCDVLLRGKCDGNGYECAGFHFTPIARSLEDQSLDGKRLTFIKRHIISRGDEAAGLTQEEIQAIKLNYDGDNIPDSEFRKYKLVHHNKPLLIVVFALVSASKKEVDTSGKSRRVRIGERRIVPAYGISFPGDPTGRRRPEKTVAYTVNRVWLTENQEWQDDTDDQIETEVDE